MAVTGIYVHSKLPEFPGLENGYFLATYVEAANVLGFVALEVQEGKL